MTAAETLPAHLLIVDDDARLRRLLAEYLSKEGFAITVASDAASARCTLAMFLFDLIVLDVMMPGETGTELAAALRSDGDATPILMLTAMGESEERIAGLEAGADDYLVKPFEPRELALRIRSILRRSREVAMPDIPEMVAFGAFVFYPGEGRLLKDAEPIYLTTVESALLAALADRRGEVVTRAELVAAASGEVGNERSVDVQITRLRKKIELEPARPLYIQTVRGTGYILRSA